ncbi:MAG: HAD-IIIA family hydrolase [Lachnospiraceae bacterium]|jgi:mannose-1-phosphate guanylyltransferase/phosphomannomutase|nr:HAD-IIIA family hydrolase [Lachnospiraceae bacterium]
MQAVIMAGGKGTRLAALTKDEVPKPMVAVAGKPLLLWQVERLKENGFMELILVIGHLGEKIREYFGNGEAFGVHIRYVEEKTPLGTAGSFYYLRDLLADGPFLMLSGDLFFDIDLNRMVRFHEEHHAAATLFVHPNGHPFDSDLLVLDETERIKKFDSKHNVRDYWYDNCVNAGLMVLDKSICKRVPKPVKLSLENDILNGMIEAKEAVYGYRSPEYVKDVGTVDRIQQALSDLERGVISEKCLKNRQKCIFLDRDGTINRFRGLIYKEEDFELESCAVEAVRRINESGRLGIVVTNQPSVARGLCAISDIETIHRKMASLLGREGVYLDDVLFCPHHPDKGYPEENPAYKIPCECRKPKTGMIQKAAERYHIDLAESWIIGDTTTDIQAGINAGLKTALVLTGEAGQDKKYDGKPDLVCRDLLEAVEKILAM